MYVVAVEERAIGIILPLYAPCLNYTHVNLAFQLFSCHGKNGYQEKFG